MKERGFCLREKKISLRLKNICDMVPKTSKKVLDVGTDHGYVPIYLVRNKQILSAIAADISGPSLQKAKDEIEKNNLTDSISVREGDGLQVIRDQDEIDTVIIAGMGGVLISEILEQADHLSKKNAMSFVLQPVQGVEELRIYLNSHNYKIMEEKFFKWSGKFYQSFLCELKESENVFQKTSDDDYCYELSKEWVTNPSEEVLEYVEKQEHILCVAEESLMRQCEVVGLNLEQQNKLELIKSKKLFYERVKKNASERIGR